MNPALSCRLIVTAIAAGTAITAPAAAAQDGLQVTRFTIDAGGGRVASSRFVLHGTVAQPDADPVQPSSDASQRFVLRGGFWATTTSLAPGTMIFRNGFE